MGVFFFIGMSLGALCLGHLADTYGRKPVFFFSATVFAFFVLLLLKAFSLGYLYFVLFFTAFLHVSRMSQSYILGIEFAPTKIKPLVTAFLFSLDGATILINCILLKITRNMLYSMLFSLFMTLLCLWNLRKLPESPDWLFSKGRWD